MRECHSRQKSELVPESFSSRVAHLLIISLFCSLVKTQHSNGALQEYLSDIRGNKDTIKYAKVNRKPNFKHAVKPCRNIIVTLIWSSSTVRAHTRTQASHSHSSHTMTVFIQALDSGGAHQRAPFTSPWGLNSLPPSWGSGAPLYASTSS